jgi:hypothetical protein
MLNPLPLLIAAFLFTGFAAFSQETSEKIVPLRLSGHTDLVHFELEGYVLSFRRADLLESFATYSWLQACTAILAAGDTLDYYDVDDAFFDLCDEHRIALQSFDKTVRQCLADGRVKIHSSVSGKDLARVRYAENCANAINKMSYRWIIEDVSTGAPVFGQKKLRSTITPSF